MGFSKSLRTKVLSFHKLNDIFELISFIGITLDRFGQDIIVPPFRVTPTEYSVEIMNNSGLVTRLRLFSFPCHAADFVLILLVLASPLNLIYPSLTVTSQRPNGRTVQTQTHPNTQTDPRR